MSALDPSSEIDRLAHAAEAAGGSAPAQEPLWRALFGLSRWWLIPVRQDTAFGPQVSPFAIELRDRPSIVVFTSQARALTFAHGRGLSGTEDELTLPVPSRALVATAHHYGDAGVQDVVFDVQDTGFSIPLAQLVPVWTSLFGAPPTGLEPPPGDAGPSSAG